MRGVIIIKKKNSFFKLDLLILLALKNNDRYGYDLSLAIKENTDSMFDLKEGVMYPILYKLLEDKCITSYTQTHKNRTRVYYHIEKEGLDRLDTLVDEFNKGVDLIENYVKREG